MAISAKNRSSRRPDRNPRSAAACAIAILAILLIAVTYVAVNLITDLTYGLLDPRIRYR